MKAHFPLTVAILLTLYFAPSDLRAESWPQFRGDHGLGVASTSSLPTRWSESKGIRWSTDLPGRGNSSPAVTSRRIDVTTQAEDQSLWVISIDRESGKILQKVKVGNGSLAAKGPANLYAHRHNPATPSPIADEENIWAFFGTGLLVCVDARNGKIRWQRDLVRDYGEYDITFGMGSSPRLHGDRLFVACMTKGPSYVVAFDKSTGEEIWKTERRLPADDDGPDAYSTPTIYQTADGISLLVSGSDHVDAYHLSTGKRIWQAAGLKIDSPYGRVIASPIGTQQGIVLATSGNPAGAGKGHLMAVKFGQSAKELWRIKGATSDSSSPVIVDDYVYLITDAGIATCADVQTGEIIWKKRVGSGGAPFHASLVAGDGKIYFLNIDGQCTVIEHGKSGKPLAVNQLDGTFYATPALADGKIYLRAYERLYAIDGQ